MVAHFLRPCPICFRKTSGFQGLDHATRLIWSQAKYSLNRFQIPVEAIGQRAHQLANKQYWITAHGIFGIDPHFPVSIVQFVSAGRSFGLWPVECLNDTVVSDRN